MAPAGGHPKRSWRRHGDLRSLNTADGAPPPPSGRSRRQSAIRLCRGAPVCRRRGHRMDGEGEQLALERTHRSAGRLDGQPSSIVPLLPASCSERSGFAAATRAARQCPLPGINNFGARPARPGPSSGSGARPTARRRARDARHAPPLLTVLTRPCRPYRLLANRWNWVQSISRADRSGCHPLEKPTPPCIRSHHVVRQASAVSPRSAPVRSGAPAARSPCASADDAKDRHDLVRWTRHPARPEPDDRTKACRWDR